MISMLSILGGYAYMVWQFGWAGVAIIVVHVAIMAGAAELL